VSRATTVVVPVTATTTLQALTFVGLSNQSGTFSIGGLTAQAPGEVCPGGPATGEACHAGGGVGGTMALTGTMYLYIIPTIVPIPILLGDAGLGLGAGGSTNLPFTADAGAWSTGAGYLGLASGTASTSGMPSPLKLVSPAYTNALGNEISFVASLTLTAVSLPVPEASAALLVGCAGLAALAVRRR
jgi:hypothetical protein